MKRLTWMTVPAIAAVLSYSLLAANGSEVIRAHKHEYVSLDLGTFGGNLAQAFGINSKSQIVGNAGLSPGVAHAFLRDSGGMIDLGTLGGDGSVAEAINDRGDVAGSASIPPGSGAGHAVIWRDGNVQDLNPPGAIASSVHALNNRGQAVGFYQTPAGIQHACLWENGRMTDLNVPAEPASHATGINDRGQIVGYYRLRETAWCSFRWERGSYENIGPCFPYPNVNYPTGINDRGQIVGILPFLFDAGNFLPIGIYFPRAINKRGQVAGATYGANGRLHTAIWDDGVAIDIDPGNPFPSQAFAINDRAEVAGIVFAPTGNRAYLWTPAR
jgi:probable HAF family extracellular repeat protein